MSCCIALRCVALCCVFRRDHLRSTSGIICGSESFAVQFGDHFRSGYHLWSGIICSAVQISCRSYVCSVLSICAQLHFMLLIYDFSDRSSSQIRYAAFLKYGIGHALFKCLGWLCPVTIIFLLIFRDTNTDTLPPCAPKHVIWQRVFRGASELKVRNLI